VKKKYFFGWTNIKFFIVELIKLGSNSPSFFSQERIHQGIAFVTMISGLIYWLLLNTKGMPVLDIIAWAGLLGVICGYQLKAIMDENKDIKKDVE